LKKLDTSRSDSFQIKGVRLHLDDLEHIYAVLERDMESIRITDEDYEFDSLMEFADKRGLSPEFISLDSESRSDDYLNLSIQIKGMNVFVHRWRSEGPFYEIKEFLWKKRLRLFPYLNPLIWVTLTFVAFAFLGNAFAELEIKEGPLLVVGGSAVTGFFLMTVISVFYRSLYCGLHLKRKHEGGFFRRNLDRILLLLIGSLMGIIGSLFVQWVVRS